MNFTVIFCPYGRPLVGIPQSAFGGESKLSQFFSPLTGYLSSFCAAITKYHQEIYKVQKFIFSHSGGQEEGASSW